MRSRTTSIFFVSLLICTLAWSVHGAGSGPIALGTWTLDVSKSKYEPGPAPSSAERNYIDAGNRMVTVSVKTQYADGRAINATATYAYDGSHHSVNGNQDYDEIAVKRTGPRSTRTVLIRDARVVGHLTTNTCNRNGKHRQWDLWSTTHPVATAACATAEQAESGG